MAHRAAVAGGVALAALVAQPALAGAPDHVAHLFRVDDADVSVKRLAWSSDGEVMVGATGSGRVFVLDADTWKFDTTDGCESRAAAVEAEGLTGNYLVYVGCNDGTIHTLEWNGFTLSVHEDATGAPEVVQIAQNPLLGVWVASDGRVYGLAEAAGDAERLHDWSPVDGTIDHLGSAVELFKRDFREAAYVRASGGDILYVAHGGNDFSQVTIATGTTVPTVGQAIQLEIDDLTPNVLSGGVPTGVLIADPDRGIVVWNGSTGIGAVTPFQVLDASVSNAHAIAVQYNAAGTFAESYLVQSGSTIKAFPSLGTGASPTASFDVDFRVVDLVTGPYGYVFAGTPDGDVAVLTSRPWVSDFSLDPVSGPVGTEVTVSFQSDEEGTWKLLLGGTRAGDGTELASGSVEAGGTVSANVTVDATWGEGSVNLYAVVTSDAETGHARASFGADNAPPQVSLGAANVGFSDSALVVDFAMVDADDIDRYDIYISTEPFSPDDWASGGPTSDAASGLVSPVSVSPAEGDTRVQTRIEGLDNYVVYYLAARAFDASGKEGPMSNVVEGMPQPTYSAGELVGEQGGAACASLGGAGRSWLGAAGIAAWAVARRRRGGALGLLGLTFAFAPADASAQEERSRGLSRFDRDITPAWASFEIRHDFQQFGFSKTNDAAQQVSWDALRSSYGSWGSVMRLEAGPQFFRVFEIDFGVGFMSHKGNKIADDGTASADETRLEWVPLSFGGTLRAHILDEQPFVPFVSAGIDYVYFREDELDGDTINKAAKLEGSKTGWHWAAGGNILLDSFSPSRAARLEAGTGINDTWLTVTYSQQRVGVGSGGFDFSGWALGVGLKLDY